MAHLALDVVLILVAQYINYDFPFYRNHFLGSQLALGIVVEIAMVLLSNYAH